MGQSLARLHIHLIFSTKHRAPWITDTVRDSMHAYMATVLQDTTCVPVLINSVEDHIHLLFDLGRTVAISDVVERVKKTSSKWIKSQGPKFVEFAWQSGYGAFAVSESTCSKCAIMLRVNANIIARNRSKMNSASSWRVTTFRSTNDMSGIDGTDLAPTS